MTLGTMKKVSLVSLATKTVRVMSDSTSDIYEVTISASGEALGCDCPAGRSNRPCKHLFRAQVRHSKAFLDAAKALIGTVYKDKAAFQSTFDTLSAELGVNAAIKEVLDLGLRATDRRRVTHAIDGWRDLI